MLPGHRTRRRTVRGFPTHVVREGLLNGDSAKFSTHRKVRFYGPFCLLNRSASLRIVRFFASHVASHLPSTPRGDGTVQAVAESWLNATRTTYTPRTHQIHQTYLNRYILPAISRERIADITRLDLQEIIDRRYADKRTDGTKGKPGAAIVVRRTLRALWAFATDKGLVSEDSDPTARLKLRHQPAPRTRVLTDTELREAWNAPWPGLTEPIIKLLMLTGARLSEITDLEWREIRADGWAVLPPGRNKSKSDDRWLYLPAATRDLIEPLRELGGRYVFPSPVHPDRPVTVNGVQQMQPRILPNSTWHRHDLRRTMRTRLATLGTPEHIAELAIGEPGDPVLSDLLLRLVELAEALRSPLHKERLIRGRLLVNESPRNRARVFVLTMDRTFFRPVCGRAMYGTAATVAGVVLEEEVSRFTVRSIVQGGVPS